MSQRSGRVRGQGFLASSALEARADREGAMAAAGEQVYTGPVTHALSDASPSPASASPMQAKRNGGGEDPDRGKPDRKILPGTAVEEGALGYDDLDPDLWEERAHEQGLFSRMFGRKRKFYKARIDRRPWEMTREELDANPSNPNNVAELNTVQNEIATAGSTTSGRNPVKKNGVMNRKAWKAFQNYGKSKHTQTYLLTGKEWKRVEDGGRGSRGLHREAEKHEPHGAGLPRAAP